MSKKRKKESALVKELERRIGLYLRNPIFNTEPFQEYCEKIKEKAHDEDDCDDCAYVNFIDWELYLPSDVHQLTEAVAMISPMYADHYWVKVGEKDFLDDEVYVGMIDDPITNIPTMRAFWYFKIEMTGEYRIVELDSFNTVALAAYHDEDNNVTVNYALLSCFIKGKMHEYIFYETKH